jgi:ferredoxin
MEYQVLIEDTGEHYACDERESVLQGMARLGRRGIPLGCRGGGCGICKVQILNGDFEVKAMSRAHVSVEELAAGTVLACRVMPQSDLCVHVVGKMKKQF